MAITVIRSAREQALTAVQQTVADPDIPAKHLLTGTQRRIWDQIAADLRAERSVAGRVDRALKLGYDPIVPPANWHAGLALHDHSWRQHTSRDDVAFPMTLFGVFAGILAFSVGLVVASQTMGVVKALALLATVVPTVVFPTVAIARCVLSIFPEVAVSRCTFYAQPIPATALTAYHRAKATGLFDSILIMSPDNAVFETWVSPQLRVHDPLMVGRIGGHYFLLAFWDLAADIAFAEGVAVPQG